MGKVGRSQREVVKRPANGSMGLFSFFRLARPDQVQRALRVEVEHLRENYRELEKRIAQLDPKAAKTDMQASKEARRAGMYMPMRHGAPDGVSVGDKFRGKGEMSVTGIHDLILSGISKPNPKLEKEAFQKGAYAIVMSKAYKDVEEGNRITYIGEGLEGRMGRDQSIKTPGNEALMNNITSKQPVRVCKQLAEADENGNRYVYDGLYNVLEHRSGEEPLSEKFQTPERKTRLVHIFTLERHADNEHGSTPAMPHDPSYAERFIKKRPSMSILGTPKRSRVSEATREASINRPAVTTPQEKQWQAPPEEGKQLAPAASVPPHQQNSPDGTSHVHHPEKGRLVCADISCGKEPAGLEIPVYNAVDDSPDLPNFTYTECNIVLADVVADSIARACKDTELRVHLPFGCGPICAEKAYKPLNARHKFPRLRIGNGNTNGIVVGIDESNLPLGHPLAVVRNGRQVPLELYKTRDHGWGVRCPELIRKGTYVCEYAGEIIPYDQATDGQHDGEYMMDLDHYYISWEDTIVEKERQMGEKIDTATLEDIQKRCLVAGQQKPLTIDALRHGNIGRFVNHSFLHNCIFCLFATRDIPANEEIVYNYGYDLVKSDALPAWYQRALEAHRQLSAK